MRTTLGDPNRVGPERGQNVYSIKYGKADAEGARGGDSARSQGGGRRAGDRRLARRAEGERPPPGAHPDVSPPSRRRMLPINDVNGLLNEVQVVVEDAEDDHLSLGITMAGVRRFCCEFGFPWLGKPKGGEKDDYESKYERELGSWIEKAYGSNHLVGGIFWPNGNLLGYDFGDFIRAWLFENATKFDLETPPRGLKWDSCGRKKPQKGWELSNEQLSKALSFGTNAQGNARDEGDIGAAPQTAFGPVEWK
eukprot:1734357-Prymnesium_polylepis.1